MLWDTTTAQSYRELRLMTDFSDGGEDENDGKGDLTRGEKVGHTGSPVSVFKACESFGSLGGRMGYCYYTKRIVWQLRPLVQVLRPLFLSLAYRSILSCKTGSHRALNFNPAPAHSMHQRLGPVADRKFAVDIAQMEFHGALAEPEFLGHTPVAPALRQRAEHIKLACG
jgi:hypothetical protein